MGTVAFGAFDAPDYETPAKVIPAVGTRTGVPAVQGTNRLYFNLFLPAGAAPAGGWPVAIFGHGFTDNKNGEPVQSSPARWRGAGSRRSRSTSSATAAARSAR